MGRALASLENGSGALGRKRDEERQEGEAGGTPASRAEGTGQLLGKVGGEPADGLRVARGPTRKGQIPLWARVQGHHAGETVREGRRTREAFRGLGRRQSRQRKAEGRFLGREEEHVLDQLCRRGQGQ